MMKNNFQKYEGIIKSLFTESDVDQFLIADNELFSHQMNLEIRNSPQKIKLFFTEFANLPTPDKYGHFRELTRDTSEWISVFLDESAEGAKKREYFDILMSIIKFQQVDIRESLLLNEAMLFESREIGLIDAIQFDSLRCSLDRKGKEATKIEFLFACLSKSIDCYGKLLYIFYRSKCKFIETYLPDLQKAIEKLESEQEVKDMILGYAASIVELNRTGRAVSHDETGPVGVDSQKESREQVPNAMETDYCESVRCGLDDVTHTDGLVVTDAMLRASKKAGLLSESQLRELLEALQSDRGDANHKHVRGDYLAAIMCGAREDWYGRLLCLSHTLHTDFIARYFPDLHLDLQTMSSEDERQGYITGFGNSIILSTRSDSAGPDPAGSAVTTPEMGGIEFDCASDSGNVGSELLQSFPSAVTMAMDTDLKLVQQSIGSCEMEENINITDPPPSFSPYSELGKPPPAVSKTTAPKQASNYKDEDDSDDESDHDSDEVCFDELFGRMKNKSASDILNFSVSENKKQADRKPLEMRSYQNELAEKGIEGKNVLICSPTGSGKTIVAVKIVEEHLARNQNGKVAFLVHRIALVEQQYSQFSNYLKCRLTRLSGSAKSQSTPLIGHLNHFDVFVLTSDILKNALEGENETKLESINVFTLVLFDECHNCDKKHPYNRIMTHYFKEKKANKRLPQIIGLTASTGTNKANTMDKALKRLYSLCANLDTCLVSTVDLYKDELEQSQSRPKEEIITPSLRSNDKFDSLLQEQMAMCEKMLHGMNARDFFPKDQEIQAMLNIPEDRLHQKYLGFVGKLGTDLYNKTAEKNEGRQAVFTISRYLNAFVRALMVNHLFRAADAVRLIQDDLELECNNPEICQVETILRKKLKNLGEFQDEERVKNPCLECLKDQIKNQLEHDPQSRIIVFVRERNYTQILKSIFSSVSGSIKCDTIVGNTISAEQGGLTQTEMEEVLGRFRRGVLNVLFCTTVAEEGLDIQKCNLVIRYGHVTNETAMVQSRGRARAQDSKYIVIVPFKLQWQVNKENINRYRESMMYRAIEKFQKMDFQDIQYKIQECQYERELLETCDQFSRQSISNKMSANTVWNFHCKKCTTPICQSIDIRVAEDAHHIVINQDCFQHMKVFMMQNKNSCQIKCKKCSIVLGNRQKFKNRLFPTLKIDSFSLNCEGQDGFRSFKKWKDVPFLIADYTNAELLNFQPDHELAE